MYEYGEAVREGVMAGVDVGVRVAARLDLWLGSAGIAQLMRDSAINAIRQAVAIFGVTRGCLDRDVDGFIITSSAVPGDFSTFAEAV
jgi:hypothetical protein